MGIMALAITRFLTPVLILLHSCVPALSLISHVGVQRFHHDRAHSLYALPNRQVNQDINVDEKTDISSSDFEKDIFSKKLELDDLNTKNTNENYNRNAAESPDRADATDESFDWFDHWYPVNVVATMDPTRPHKAQLLGLNLVLWNSGGEDATKEESLSSWNAFRDACPHRMAPLSEGRIEIDDNNDATLFCSYHGWTFGEEGSCTSIPYSPPKLEERHRQAPRACAEVYPSRTIDGFVWVFPQSGMKGIMRSEQRPLPLISELHGEIKNHKGNTKKVLWKSKIPAGVRDFPCGFDTMIENTLDPAHFCAAHHGTLGNRYTDPAAYTFQKRKKSSSNNNSDQQQATGFSNSLIDLEGDMGSLEFIPPCLVKYRPDYSAMPFEENLVIGTYCVPTKPGWVRPLATVAVLREENESNQKKKWNIMNTPLAMRALSVFMSPISPAWFGHIASSIVLHQDAGLLHHQYQNMKAMGYYDNNERNDPSTTTKTRTSYRDLCFTPNSVDKGIITFRRWFEKKAGGNVPWSSDCGSSDCAGHHHDPAVDIYDMWDAHTQHCSYCQDAYRRLEALKKASYATALGGFFFIHLLVPPNDENNIRGTLLIMAALGLGLALDKFNELFIRYEYHHHDND